MRVFIFLLLSLGSFGCSDEKTDPADLVDFRTQNSGDGGHQKQEDVFKDSSMSKPDLGMQGDTSIEDMHLVADSSADMKDGGSVEDTGTIDEPKPRCDENALANKLSRYPNTIPTTHRISRRGAKVTVELGVSGDFSGIGSSLIIKNSAGLASGNMIEPRLGAGAAHQFTMFADSDNKTLVMNQAAGNSTPNNWGYHACLWEKTNHTILDGQRWLAMDSDEYRVGGSSTATDPFLSGAQKSLRVLSGRPIWELLPLNVGALGEVVEIRKTWVIKNTSNRVVNLTNEISWDALYHRPQFSIEHNMRMIYGWHHSNGAPTYDVIRPHAPMGSGPANLIANRLLSAPANTVQYEYIDIPLGKWAMHTFPSAAGYLNHIMYVFEVGGETVGVAMKPPVQGRTALGFVGKTYQRLPNEHPGTIHLYSIFEEGKNLILQPDEERRYTISYYVGSLPQLAAAGFKAEGTVPVADCSACLGNASSCYEACNGVVGRPGHCAAPGSVDPNACCICY